MKARVKAGRGEGEGRRAKAKAKTKCDAVAGALAVGFLPDAGAGDDREAAICWPTVTSMSAVTLRRAPFWRTWIAPAVDRAILLGSSLFTLTLDHRDGFVNHSENNTHILRLARSHPDRLAAWPTLDPREPQNSWRVKSYAGKGATGIKLYVGHGACNAFSGEPIFHVCRIDDDCMLPVYETCAELGLPICLHVNCGIAGYWSELLRVLDRFRDLKFVIPHFALSTRVAGSAAFPARTISERPHRHQLRAG